jgi:hypothetical protein
VDETRRARDAGAGRDLDHAAAMVAERTRQRYAAYRDDGHETAARLERLSGTPGNVAGIMRWLDKSEPEDQPPSRA